MGLGFRLHLLSGDQQLFLIILHKYNYKYFYFINDMSSCKLYHDFILAPIKCQNKKQQQQQKTRGEGGKVRFPPFSHSHSVLRAHSISP